MGERLIEYGAGQSVDLNDQEPPATGCRGRPVAKPTD
jgi:hypothetical protein